MIERLYPRLGLLGGAPETGGKVSKLAALAAVRKKEGGRTASTPETPSTPQPELSEKAAPEPRGTSLSLRDRLNRNTKPQKPSETSGSLHRLNKSGLTSQLPAKAAKVEPSPEATNKVSETTPISTEEATIEPKEQPELEQRAAHMRASPSTFANTIVGDAARRTMVEPSHLHCNSVDLLRIYGQDPAEHFDFVGPSPDDVVLNAQNTAKGLAIRKKG